MKKINSRLVFSVLLLVFLLILSLQFKFILFTALLSVIVLLLFEYKGEHLKAIIYSAILWLATNSVVAYLIIGEVEIKHLVGAIGGSIFLIAISLLTWKVSRPKDNLQRGNKEINGQ
ncbi:hypothetical protein A3L04_04740 [Thermococcus chitonophagus]|uniref:Uncharacterized protein n=1 Tax=Thermococcus chitonophagus TaxID=54262 RepID=A0A2Z2N3L5_9EURY|nr:hypothetical protein [Thermococcus chitonophagus]ASJ16431.1 hypothetical protein A3L04_04740 [Thermococcus chitonophagus]